MNSPARQNRRPHPKRGRASRASKPSRSAPAAKTPQPPRKNQTAPLTTPNLANILSSFYTIRSTVQQLSDSLQRMEKIMSNAYQMFEIANTFMGRRQEMSEFMPRRRPRLRLIKPREEEDIPQLDLPEEPPGGGGSFGIPQLFKLMQSPLVQQILSGIMSGKTPDVVPKQKQG